MKQYAVGDYVRIICRPDGATFEGILQDWDDHCLYLNGYGFPLDDVLDMEPAGK